MNYIVLDLEWNQSNTGREKEIRELPFEIIEIGAIKLDEKCKMIGEFSEVVKPQVYREMHRVTSRLIHVQMQELKRGRPFPEVVEQFLEWCGEDYQFCTWGTLDLAELQRNMQFYQMTPLSNKPIAFLDVQKLFSIAYEDRKSRRALEYAIDFLEIEKDIPFHRAFSDAYYTAKVLTILKGYKQGLFSNVSYDLFHPPKSREDEVKVQFDTYAKYISREFRNKAEAFSDREVVSSKCYRCHCNLRKRVKWFTPNGKHYYCVAYCDKHGYLKGKVRIHKAEEDRIYIVKTTKLITEADAQEIEQRRQHAKEMRKRRKKNRDHDE